MQETVPSLAVAVVLVLAAVLAFKGRSRRRGRMVLEARGLPDRGPGGGGRGAASPLDVRAGHRDGLRDTAMMLELTAAMLDAGAGIGRALELIAACAAPPISRSLRPVVAALAIGADWETAWRSSSAQTVEVLRLKDALAFAALTGAPSAAILYAQAARERRERFRTAEKKAAALGVKLVIPLGLCSLPAFLCLGVVPVLIAMLPSG